MADLSSNAREFFERLFKDPVEDRVIEYVVREVDLGRQLFEILEDPFVRNRITNERRSELLENSEIIEAFQRELAELRNK